jgi:integrase
MTNRIAFTQAAVDRLRPPDSGRVVIWDRHLPGFGLRVSALRSGDKEVRKTWVAMGRVDGKPVMVTLGTLSAIPKVDQARDLARAAILKMRSGTTPLAERQAERTRKEAEIAAVEAAAREAEEGRFGTVAERFLTDHVARNCSKKYAYEVRRILEHDVLPRWGDRPICSLTKHDVNELLDVKAKTRERPRKGTMGGAGIQANKTLTRLRTLFAWAVAQGLVDADPSAGVLRRGRETARERVLSDSEMIWLWRGCEAIGWPYGAIFKLMLLTAQREGEVAGMCWSELDLGECQWTIPWERTKNDREHIVHLSALAVEIIEGLPRLGGPFVFPSRAAVPVASFSKPKRRLDTAMTAQLHEGLKGESAGEVTPWTLHDIRRTSTSTMARLGIAPHVADRVLNHTSGTIRGVAAIYNRFAYLDERKGALEALGRFVENLVRPGVGNIVELRPASGG